MKSQAIDQLELATLIYDDAVAKCIAVNPSRRDLMTIRSRVENEGLSFLTITLPQFCKDFERSLADGVIDPTYFRSFRKNGAIPAFLQGMLGHIFDRSTGVVYDKVRKGLCDISTYVGSIRQICLAFKKLELDCKPERVCSAIESFVETERDLNEAIIPDHLRDLFDRVSMLLWDDCIRTIEVRALDPKHGPGATAERISGNGKYVWRWWHDRLEPFFPLLESAYSVSAYGSKEFEDVTIVSSDEESPVRVTPVPKTQKGPRIIAIEPCCMQYTQQAIRGALYKQIESSRISGGHVNFTNQQVNRDLAMKGSLTGEVATLDLSDASDRVLYDLAIRMFNSNPDLRDAIMACRSTRAQLPDGRIIGPLKKFASMGSALCFPIESMYFYTICVVALLDSQKTPVTRRSVTSAANLVYVYGDDIIVPSRLAITVCDYLQKYYCKVNMSKSFWTGWFRESCGMDAFLGTEVTPTYVRQTHPTNRRQASKIVSWVKTANLFYKRGYWKTSSYMFNVCERYIGKLPYVSETSAGLGRTSFQQYRSIGRWNRYLQRLEVRAWTAAPVYSTDTLQGYGALQKSLLNLSASKYGDGSVDEQHLLRSARHGAVTLKRRWIPVD